MTVEVPQIQFLDGGMVGISGLGAWFDSGYMVYVSPWVLLNRLPCSPCTWNWTLRYEPLVPGTSCSLFGVGAMLVRLWIHVQLIRGGFWKNFFESLHEGVDSGS